MDICERGELSFAVFLKRPGVAQTIIELAASDRVSDITQALELLYVGGYQCGFIAGQEHAAKIALEAMRK